MTGPTLHQALAALGYTTASTGNLPSGIRLVLRNGRVVTRGRAGDVWSWLHRRDRKLAALRGAL